MIVDKDNNPERQLYYIGAKILGVLDSSGAKMDFFDAYQKLKSNEDISVRLFILALDWLYLLGAIKSEKGIIEKCF